MEPEQGIKSWQWVVTVIVIVILVILGYYMLKGGSNTPTVTETPSATDTSDTTSNEINRIVVSDQYPGNIVYVSSVQLENGGFVVIHKDDNGTPGAVIGSGYFDKGINPGKITLTATTVEGGVYYAMLHSDDGDKKFDAVKDISLKDTKGDIIMKLVRATAGIREIKG